MEKERTEIKEVNPHTCRFVVTYADGSILKGNALSTDDWLGKVHDGISKLEYEIDGIDKIEINKSKAYSYSVDYDDSGNRPVYYFIKVKCLMDNDTILVHSINLRDVPGSALKIGDIITGKEVLSKDNNLWKTSG